MYFGETLLAQIHGQSDGLGAPIDLLMSRGTVARSVVGRAIKDLAAVTGAE